MARYVCTVCDWVYDEDVEGQPFAELPEDWTCPVCGMDTGVFEPE